MRIKEIFKFFVIIIGILGLILIIIFLTKHLRLRRRVKIDKFDSTIYDTKLDKNPNIIIDELSKPYIKDGKVNQKKLFGKGKMDHYIQKENLLLLKQFLESHNIKYFIDCGTLIGAIRDKGFVKGDTDVDISVGKVGVNKIISLFPELERLGFISFRNCNDGYLPMSLLRKGEYIDIYSHHDFIPFELEEFPFLGTTFPIPKYYDEYLSENYNTWKVPSEDNGNGSWEKGMPKYVKKWTVNLVIVTGACSNYADKLARLIGSIHHYEPHIYIYVYDLGLTKKQVAKIKTYRKVIYKQLDLSKYPSWIPKRIKEGDRGMKAALKVPVLYELLNEIPHDIVWLDAGNQIGGDLGKVKKAIREKGMFTTCLLYDSHMQTYTHQGMLDYLGLVGYKEKGVGHVSPGIFGVSGGTTSEVYQKIIKPAMECTLKKACVDPPGASLKNHRYDASILSALLVKNKMDTRCGTTECPSYFDCMGVTICNRGISDGKCPKSKKDHGKYTIQFRRGGGPTFTPLTI